MFFKTSRLNFIFEKSNIAKTLNQNKIHEMQILQKHSGVSTVGAMGVPPNSGKNCSNFDTLRWRELRSKDSTTSDKILITIKVIWKRNKSS